MSWDRALLQWANWGLANPVLDLLMAGVSLAAIPVVAMLPVLLWLRGARKKAAGLLVVLVLSLIGAVAFQALFARSRPADVRLPLPTPATPSFPSGHAACVFGCALFVTLTRRRVSPAGWLGAILVAGSRVYLGHHYPSDVLGGASLGLASGAIVYGVLCRTRDTARPRWAWLLWGQVAVLLLGSLGAYLGLYHPGALFFAGADKALHLCLFGALAFLAVGWWAQSPAGVVLAWLGLLATAEETLQMFSAIRAFDPLDLLATLAGIVLFGCLGAIAKGARRSYLTATPP